MKIVSWNVNGIRAVMKKGFIDYMKELDADIICLQETKAHPEQVDSQIEKLSYKHKYWNSAERPGYSGVAIFSKTEPLSIKYGIGHPVDNEGRVITAEYDKFYLVTVYTPNAKDDLSRIPLRYNEWDPQFLKHCKELEKTKPVIFCGDLNVAHQEIDLKNDKANRGKKGFTDEERERFTDFVNAGFIDTFRELYPNEEKYSWWTYMGKARDRNVGWRIDYFLISKELLPNLKDAKIHNEIFGSDHCPVSIEIKL